MVKDVRSLSPDKRAILANVALLYYGDGLIQGDIARRLRVSRATIVNMLREAREAGIVDIRVDGRSLSASTLASDLVKKFGLQDVYLAHPRAEGEEITREGALRLLGRVGAIALSEIVKPGDKLGIAWGETMRSVSDFMPRAPVENVSVFQMIGSMYSDVVPTSESCTIDIANMLGAECHTLHAPALTSSPEICKAFKSEPTIRRQLDALKTLDMTVASVGHVSDATHLARAAMVTPHELASARKAGAAGVLCCRFIDADGRPLDLPPGERLISMHLEDILNAERRLLVVAGPRRVEATIAAIRGGFVTHLCLDNSLAKALLEADF